MRKIDLSHHDDRCPGPADPGTLGIGVRARRGLPCSYDTGAARRPPIAAAQSGVPPEHWE